MATLSFGSSPKMVVSSVRLCQIFKLTWENITSVHIVYAYGKAKAGLINYIWFTFASDKDKKNRM